MDWNRAKTILIVLLLITNITLLSTYFSGALQSRNRIDTSAYDYTMKVLAEHQITVNCQVPDSPLSMKSLVVTFDQYDRDTVVKAISDETALNSKNRSDDDYIRAAGDFLSACKIDTTGSRFSSVIREGGKVVVLYKNYYNDIPLEECFMKVFFRNGKIVDFDRQWMHVEEASSYRNDTLTALSALLSFMRKTGGQDAIQIEDIHIAYWIDPADIDINVVYDTALPAWCIVYDGGQIMYIPANIDQRNTEP